MGQTFSFNGVLTSVATNISANGTFSGTFDPVTKAVTLSGNTFYTTGSATNPITAVPLTGGTVTPGSVPVVVAGGTSSSTWLLNVLGVDVFNNVASQTFTGSGTATAHVQQTITLFDANRNVLQGTFTPIPEPETYVAVAALGLVGFGYWRRRNA